MRTFTLESGQEEIERQNRRRKERSVSGDLSESRRGSVDSVMSPTASHQRAPSLSDVPEDGTFAIGDDEDTDDENHATPTTTPPAPSTAPSVGSSVDSSVPIQLRGMSEKARGKMPGKILSHLSLCYGLTVMQLACLRFRAKTARQV